MAEFEIDGPKTLMEAQSTDPEVVRTVDNLMGGHGVDPEVTRAEANLLGEPTPEQTTAQQVAETLDSLM
jgi:hypothetical protein